jgi:hypothetical protein
MGLHLSKCRKCGTDFMWFSGDASQTCTTCKNVNFNIRAEVSYLNRLVEEYEKHLTPELIAKIKDEILGD